MTTDFTDHADPRHRARGHPPSSRSATAARPANAPKEPESCRAGSPNSVMTNPGAQGMFASSLESVISRHSLIAHGWSTPGITA